MTHQLTCDLDLDCSCRVGLEMRTGHAVDLLRDVGEIDLLATDPPYALGGQGSEHELTATVAVALREAATRLRPGHWAVVFAASSWRSTNYVVESVRGVVEPVRIATWCKPTSRTKAKVPGWAYASVNVIAFRKGKARCGDAVPDLDWICEAPVTIGRRAQLPASVARWAVSPFLVPGGLCLDPFAGSGALLQAAVGGGMSGLGLDLAPGRPNPQLMLGGGS